MSDFAEGSESGAETGRSPALPLPLAANFAIAWWLSTRRAAALSRSLSTSSPSKAPFLKSFTNPWFGRLMLLLVLWEVWLALFKAV